MYMATVYSRTCDICGGTALKRESVFINHATSKKRNLVCKKCSKPLNAFLKKCGLYKSIHPKATGSQKARNLKTRQKR